MLLSVSIIPDPRSLLSLPNNDNNRYNKCMSCYNHLLSVRAFILKRQTLQGKLGRSFREMSILMQNLE
jgi:katanin p80 WD40 repeat-containing subunit B1